ncbi:MAG: hypothetical protein L6Q54_06310 [Leptospiraceae bacterium]|nr:hypothetical protein [Leptospiraceae bacterium]MCK6380849.1 hypothetical protein [Leptospiraceae bacterium]
MQMKENVVHLPCPYCEKEFEAKSEDVINDNILTCPNCNNRIVLQVDSKDADRKLQKIEKTLDSFGS